MLTQNIILTSWQQNMYFRRQGSPGHFTFFFKKRRCGQHKNLMTHYHNITLLTCFSQLNYTKKDYILTLR